MIRNLRTLALAMGAVFLLGALWASSASATSIWFEGETGVQTITAEQEPDTVDKFTITKSAGSEKVTTCTHAHYTNTTNTVDTTESEIELTPTYSGCTVHPFGSSTVTVNGCDYRFHNPTTEGGLRTAKAEITCPTGSHIEIEAKLFGTFKCTITVGDQDTTGGNVTFHNTKEGAREVVTVDASLTDIDWTEHDETTSGTKATGFGACTDGSGSDGTYDGVSIARGQNHALEAKNIWIDK